MTLLRPILLLVALVAWPNLAGADAPCRVSRQGSVKQPKPSPVVKRIRFQPLRQAGQLTRQTLGGLSRRGKQVRNQLFPDSRSVRNWSTTSMLVGPAGNVLQFTRTIGPMAAPLTGIGSVGLGVISVHDFIKAKSPEKRLDASHGFLWSLQGMSGLGYLMRSKAAWIKPASQTIGVVGGTLQAGIGIHRIATGLKRKDRPRIILGALDLGAGACWGASACAVATPWTLGGFVAFTAARMAYSKRDQIKSAAHNLASGTRRAGSNLKAAASRLTSRIKHKLRRAPRTPAPRLTLPAVSFN